MTTTVFTRPLIFRQSRSVTLRTWWRPLSRMRSFFRPDGYMGSSYPVDRDAERLYAELAALRSPHH